MYIFQCVCVHVYTHTRARAQMTKPANKRKSGGASDDAPGLAPGAQKKPRKTTRFYLAGNCCECGDARCCELTKGFRDVGDPRGGGRANVPKEPTAVEDLKSKPRNPLARAIKSLTRKLWVYVHLPTHISKQLAIEIRDEGCSHSDVDKCPGNSSDYLPAPNCKWEDIARDLAGARLLHAGCTSAADLTTDSALALTRSPPLQLGDRESPDLKKAKSVVGSDPHEVSPSSTSNCCREWTPKWGRKGKMLSLLPVCPQNFLDALPESFVEAGTPKATVQIDGTDVLKEEDRGHSLLTKAGRSNKSEHAAFRGLAWTTPRGLNVEHTPLCLGKAEETALNGWWKPRLSKMPPGREVLAGRGFETCARHYPNCNFHRCPTRLAGRKQFSESEVKSDYQIFRLRCTCEVVFARVKSEKGLKDVIPQHHFGEVQHFWDWARAGSNLCEPLMPLGKQCCHSRA